MVVPARTAIYSDCMMEMISLRMITSEIIRTTLFLMKM